MALIPPYRVSNTQADMIAGALLLQRCVIDSCQHSEYSLVLATTALELGASYIEASATQRYLGLPLDKLTGNTGKSGRQLRWRLRLRQQRNTSTRSVAPTTTIHTYSSHILTAFELRGHRLKCSQSSRDGLVRLAVFRAAPLAAGPCIARTSYLGRRARTGKF